MKWNKLAYIGPVAFALLVFPGCGASPPSPADVKVGDTSGNFVDEDTPVQTPAGERPER